MRETDPAFRLPLEKITYWRRQTLKAAAEEVEPMVEVEPISSPVGAKKDFLHDVPSLRFVQRRFAGQLQGKQ